MRSRTGSGWIALRPRSQSTAKQVVENSESTTRQYALAERARALGWSEGGIEIIDEDLGRSGATVQIRGGCKVLTDTSQIDASVESRLNAVIASVLGGQRKADNETD